MISCWFDLFNSYKESFHDNLFPINDASNSKIFFSKSPQMSYIAFKGVSLREKFRAGLARNFIKYFIKRICKYMMFGFIWLNLVLKKRE